VAQIKTGVKRQDSSEELQDAIDRAQDGNRSALPIIREHLASRPGNYWQLVEYSRVVQNTQVKSYTGEGLYVHEVMYEVIERLRSDLGGEDASPLESLLIERIISCYLHVNFAENACAETIGAGERLEVVEYKQKRLDRAHKRYLAAVKALAQIRKMGPAIQINIARKQLNVAGAPPVGDTVEGQGVDA